MEVINTLAVTVALPTDAYFSLLLKYPPSQIWSLFLLCLARLVPFIALCPFLGGRVLPDPMKLGFAVALTPFFLPFLLGTSKGEIPLDIVFILHMIKEAAIGGILGFLTSIPFYAAQGAGSLIDHQSGSQSLQVTDPSTQVQSSPTGLLYNNVMLVTFFLLGGPFLLFDALMTTYSVFPTDQFINPAYFSATSPLFFHVIKMLNQMMIVVLQLSSPSIIAVLMSDLFLGIANRMAPQVQISFLLWSLKSFSGIAVLWAGWWFIIKQIDIQTINWIEMVHNIFRQMKGI